MLDLPIDQAVKQRDGYKRPLKAAYDRQIAMIDKDCLVEIKQGRQQYNICIGQVSEQADRDFAIFYNNSEMLCHDQDQLTALQAFENARQMYTVSGMKAAHVAWSDGTGASGFTSQVYLSLVRNQMRELEETYGLNMS